MAGKILNYTWRWEMPASPERVWPLVSDTHSFNQATGQGPWSFSETQDPDGGSTRTGSMRLLGAEITWDEHPFQWNEGKEFSVLRDFHRGPFLRVLSHLDLAPTASGSSLTYNIEARPRSYLWRPACRYYLAVHTRKRFDQVFANVARYLLGEVEAAYPQARSSPLGDAASRRLRNAQAALKEAQFSRDLVRRLVNHIENAPDEVCHRVKPYALADIWGVDRESLLTACLQSTRIGLLELRWDVMCPLCRGAKSQAPSLGELRNEAHCPSCNIQFDSNFDRLVEVSFRPSSQIRPIHIDTYCIGGPGNTPHIVAQRSIGPGERLSMPADLTPGVYRLRGPQISSSALLEVDPSRPELDAVEFYLSRGELLPPRIELSPGTVQVGLTNTDQTELVAMLERMDWPDDAVTAAQLTARQDFRDLFSSEVLAPEEQFQVQHLTFMFTDLRESTAMYREKGDAPAYILVRDHFQILEDCVARNRGAVVKTIGDAVMAVFSDPGDAVEAAFDIHDSVKGEAGQHLGLVLKMGVHGGPCVAINLNGRLDYFGHHG